MQFRRTAVIGLATLSVLAAGCGNRQVADVPDDRPLPDETPFLEPASPPANEVDRPNEDPGEEGGVPEDDDVGTEDGEETGDT